jgi:short-subunit dehydrogenase
MNTSYALITGASKGIGKAIAEELAMRKSNLLLVARSESLLAELAQQLISRYGVDVKWLAIDLSAIDASQQVWNWVQNQGLQVQILVNNAGYGLSGRFIDYTAREHADMIQVNNRVPVELCSLFLPMLMEQPKSYILNIASSAAYQAVPGLSTYAASKIFMLNFSRALRFELRRSPVSVTVVSPGGTATDFANRAKVAAKAVRAGEKLNMSPEAVAKLAVNAMYARKTEIITGFVNKLGAFFVWLLPKKLAEKTAASLYEME